LILGACFVNVLCNNLVRDVSDLLSKEIDLLVYP